MDAIKKRIGIVGGGQLGKMMILEAKRLGFYVAVLDPDAICPAHSICDLHIVESLNEHKGYIELSKHADVITYEWENISAEALSILENDGHIIYPSVTALKTIQNKYLQKTALNSASIPVPRLVKVSNPTEIRQQGKPENFGYPLMLKTASGGYDGKGTAAIEIEDDVETAFNQLGGGKVDLFLEEFMKFEKEISVIACRGINGDKVIYPVAENTHRNSILDTTIVPARIDEKTNKKALEIADKVMAVLDGVGTVCIELFLTDNGDIYVNEVAPRPHNSGHYTIEGCFANQFENHIRAIVGLPLGDISLRSPTVMVNLLGESDGDAKLLGLEEAYNDPYVHVHLYGKTKSKTGRKMGHYTVVGETLEKTLDRAQKFKNIIKVIGS